MTKLGNQTTGRIVISVDRDTIPNLSHYCVESREFNEVWCGLAELRDLIRRAREQEGDKDTLYGTKMWLLAGHHEMYRRFKKFIERICGTVDEGAYLFSWEGLLSLEVHSEQYRNHMKTRWDAYFKAKLEKAQKVVKFA